MAGPLSRDRYSRDCSHVMRRRRKAVRASALVNELKGPLSVRLTSATDSRQAGTVDKPRRLRLRYIARLDRVAPSRYVRATKMIDQPVELGFCPFKYESDTQRGGPGDYPSHSRANGKRSPIRMDDAKLQVSEVRFGYLVQEQHLVLVADLHA